VGPSKLVLVRMGLFLGCKDVSEFVDERVKEEKRR